MRLFEGTEFDIPPRCDRCEKLESDCECPPLPPPAPEYKSPDSQTARLAVEKRKRGKQVVVVRGLSAQETDLHELLVKIKSACGVGGTMKDESLEIQGSQLDRVREVLTKIGYRTQG